MDKENVVQPFHRGLVPELHTDIKIFQCSSPLYKCCSTIGPPYPWAPHSPDSTNLYWMIESADMEPTDKEERLYTHTMEYSSTLKEKGILQYATTWMDVEDIM